MLLGGGLQDVRVGNCCGDSLRELHVHGHWRLSCLVRMRRSCAAAAIVGTSMVKIAAARTAAIERGTCLPSLLACPSLVRRTCAAAAIVGYSVRTAAATTAAVERSTCLPFLHVSIVFSPLLAPCVFSPLWCVPGCP